MIESAISDLQGRLELSLRLFCPAALLYAVRPFHSDPGEQHGSDTAPDPQA